jgi:hypothetical protein
MFTWLVINRMRIFTHLLEDGLQCVEAGVVNFFEILFVDHQDVHQTTPFILNEEVLLQEANPLS